MSPKPKRRKCRCCSTFFFPDYRNWQHQHYCGKPECRWASKLASQQRWYRKPKNLSHFRNGEGTERVRTWRKAHPGYWRKKAPASESKYSVDDQNGVGAGVHKLFSRECILFGTRGFSPGSLGFQ